MIYVINFEDGGGQEFFLAPEGSLVSLSDKDTIVTPQQFKTMKQAIKKMDQMRPRYSKVCRIYSVEISEFETRRKIVQQENEQRRKGGYYPEDVWID